MLKDAVAVARLQRQTIKTINSRDYSPSQIKVWSQRTTAKRHKTHPYLNYKYVATIKNKIVGFANFTPAPIGIIEGLYIHKNFQSMGIGRKLLQVVEKAGKKNGVKQFQLSSTITAKDFYLKNNYKIVKKQYHKIGNKRLIVYLMKKKL